MIWLADSA